MPVSSTTFCGMGLPMSSKLSSTPVLSFLGAGKTYPPQRTPLRQLWGHLRGSQRLEAGGYTALQPVSFDILPGQSVGIVGLNGAGKSTLLQLAAGTLTPSSGQVRSLQVPPPFAFEPRKPTPTLHACLASAASCRLLRAINAVIHQLKAHPGAKTAVICPQLHDEILETWQLGPNIVRPAPALALVVGGANGGHGGPAAWF